MAHNELPFLLLSVRPEDAAAADEYAAIQRFAGLGAGGIRRIRLDRKPLPCLSLDDFSGVLLGGGPYNYTDSVKSAVQLRVEADIARLLAEVLERDFPFLGCCYGIGSLGTQIGASVDRSHAEPISSVPITLTADGRADPLFAELPETFEAFVGHKEAIRSLPDGATVLASSAACPVQAFRIGRNVYATQFHPELDVDGICTRIDIYKNYGYFEPDSAEELKAAMRTRHVEYPAQILRAFVGRFARHAP